MAAAAQSQQLPAPWPGRRPRPRAAVVVVLDEDRELAAALDAQHRTRARHASQAALRQLPRGAWDAPRGGDARQAGMGLLLLEGLLMRRVSLRDRCAAELLGAGDLINPDAVDDVADALDFRTDWRVLVPVRLAMLDRSWAVRMAPYPEIAAALTTRGLHRALRLTRLFTIVQQSRLDVRLWLLFWHLAERFGTVHRDGVHLPLPLTHEAVSYIACARRPSVSSALSRLQHEGRLRRESRGWILLGPAPWDAAPPRG